MDRDTDLFIQAFWVKCREVIFSPGLSAGVAQCRRCGMCAVGVASWLRNASRARPDPAGPPRERHDSPS